MYEHTLADLISLALESTSMGCMVHDWVEVSTDGQRAWALWADEGGTEHIQCYIDINYVDGFYETIDVWGVSSGGRGAFYGALPLL